MDDRPSGTSVSVCHHGLCTMSGLSASFSADLTAVQHVESALGWAVREITLMAVHLSK